MNVPLEITYRNVKKSDPIENLIHEKAEKLNRVCGHLSSCRIAVEKPQSHQRRGNPYRVRIDMTVPPGHELVVKRESGQGQMHDSLNVVLTDAFNAARRRLIRLTEQQRGESKVHLRPSQQGLGMVTRLFKDEGYGFLVSDFGREIYFHRNSVLHHAFKDLDIGTGVRFVEEEGEHGPQASTVEIIFNPQGRFT